MVKVSLTNQNPESSCKQAIIDIATGMCVVDDGGEIPVRLLKNRNDFVHPLLTHPVPGSSSHLYSCKYEDLQGLLDIAKCVYATLIQVENPLDCKFHIAPSPKFLQLKTRYQIPFSIDHKKPAGELISPEQLNVMISRLAGYTFEYRDTVFLEETLQVCDLPDMVDGDSLYRDNPEILQFCKQADDFGKVELRYINHFTGFGVFARKELCQGEKIAWYCGYKSPPLSDDNRYVFGRRNDVFNRRMDARQNGSISRFINHAPDKIDASCKTPCAGIIAANLKHSIDNVQGMDIIVLVAKRDILKGEQLFYDYGLNYFRDTDKVFLFKRNGTLIDCDQKKIRDSRRQRRAILREMSYCGVRHAQREIFRRPAIIFTVTILFSWFLTRS